ncbi:CsgG/HfaB family protein [Mesonia maritima]|uniref:Curli production assembly/transport component CsgG n=1 Tax=Mesonia maritima TaxID=1793873 RepID=A0ABU1K4S6_9FLAO|nr:CsgG/HfaB family protein [Mesonia maritima]MDR6300601.1 curli production assembly/transport component CsgG [Mesonia maritima]
MKYKYFAIICCAFLCSCGTYFNQPITQQNARTGEVSSFTTKLKNLPLPQEPVVVGVYNFKDQTGQYKAMENGSSFSTAVTQGGTSVLIKALEDSRWFTPIERENLSNLLQERNIIRSTRQEYSNNGKGGQVQLPPLLYAGVLLEGGVVSYDTNILTGGFGARYFGVGGSTQYKQDRITVYLRAISTSSGKILKTVYVSKTILSQAIDASLFKYVNFQRLLEVETGYTKNEPVQLAVKEAIEKAVQALIIEGVDEGLWQAKDKNEGTVLVKKYKEEKEEEQLTRLYDREYLDWKYKNSFAIDLGVNRFMGDYAAKNFSYLGRLSYKRQFTPHLGLGLNGSLLEFEIPKIGKNTFATADLNAEITILPYDKLGPYLYGGPGVLFDIQKDDLFNLEKNYFKLQYGVGVKYAVSPKIDLRVFAEHNVTFSDEVDEVVNGKLNDYFFNFGAGLSFHFGNKNKIRIKEVKSETEPKSEEVLEENPAIPLQGGNQNNQ